MSPFCRTAWKLVKNWATELELALLATVTLCLPFESAFSTSRSPVTSVTGYAWATRTAAAGLEDAPSEAELPATKTMSAIAVRTTPARAARLALDGRGAMLPPLDFGWTAAAERLNGLGRRGS